MSIHLTEEERHLPEGHQDARGIMISDLAGVLLKRLIASGMGFGFDAPMRAKRTEDLTGIEGAILQGKNGRDPIDDFIRGLLNAIRRLDDPADGENLLGKRKGYLIPRDRQTPNLVSLDTIGLRGNRGMMAGLLEPRCQ